MYVLDTKKQAIKNEVKEIYPLYENEQNREKYSNGDY